MSKKAWIGAGLVLGLIASFGSGPKKQSQAAHAAAGAAVTYSGPPLVRTNWYSQNDRDPMTGKSSYSTVLMSGDGSDTRAGLYFKCDDTASLMLVLESDQVSDQDHFFFDAKVGDGDIFQVFGQKLGTERLGTAFQLEEDKLEDLVKDGVPIYLRFTIGNQISTVSFVPNNTSGALAPIKQCKHG